MNKWLNLKLLGDDVDNQSYKKKRRRKCNQAKQNWHNKYLIFKTLYKYMCIVYSCTCVYVCVFTPCVHFFLPIKWPVKCNLKNPYSLSNSVFCVFRNYSHQLIWLLNSLRWHCVFFSRVPEQRGLCQPCIEFYI